MKLFLTSITGVVWAGAALAHPGHLAEVAGHGHWLGAAALGAAIALGAWAALKGKKQPEAQGEHVEEDGELEEATA